MKIQCKIPDGYKIVGSYRRNTGFVYLKKKGEKDVVATPFSLTDPTYNDDLPSQLFLSNK